MKKIIKPLTTVTFLVLFTNFLIPRRSDTIKILADKKHSQIEYTMVHPLHEWTGVSQNVNCAILYGPDTKRIESVAVSVPLSSFDSRNSNRDSHALEVLEALQFPTVKFVSNNIRKMEDSLFVTGNLTLHNVTHLIDIKAKQSDLKNEMRITGAFPINITDYNIEVPSLMGIKTKEEVWLIFNIAFPIK